MAEPLEFEERDIWGENTRDEGGARQSESDSDSDGAECEDPSRKRSASSSSSSDSELDGQLAESIKAFRGQGSGSEAVPLTYTHGSLRGRPRSRRESLDEQEEFSAHKLGTSMPINIPTMASRRSRSLTTEDQGDRAATFVPPHLLEQPDVQVGLSLSSASGAKREKLLQRNAILRRTGFLEPGSVPGRGGRGALPELMDPLNRRMAPIKESHLEPSALSAALGSPTSKKEP